MEKIILKPKRAVSLRRFHPWVFSGGVKEKPAPIQDGDLVSVHDHHGEFLGVGHYQDASICVRIISFEPTNAALPFWTEKIQNAYQYRQQLELTDNPDTNCYRLVHAEGDHLPGLIIDIYDRVAIVQCHSVGMYRERVKIKDALLEVYGNKLETIYDKSAESLPSAFSKDKENGFLHGKQAKGIAQENGHLFEIDWVEGQKTGFFLDQRTNRQLVAAYAKNKTVLNAFSYSGGFSIYALQAGAKFVDSVDVSKKAIELTERNVSLNGFSTEQHQAHASDVLQFLRQAEQSYDLMIVDPPAFAKSLKKRHNAVQGYKRLNAEAIRKIKPGGILFTFSCSQVVDQTLFYNTIVAAALAADRKVRVMHRLSQPPDHPVNFFHPEGSYLKGLVLFVE